MLRLLAKTPEERFQTADELLEAIEQIAVRTQIVLSTAALGRFVRELFGQRPEPWIELRTSEAQPELVTVTSEPVPVTSSSRACRLPSSSCRRVCRMARRRTSWRVCRPLRWRR